ncbi:hypothetical protein BDK51DRAFT_50999 [Blyttiomyces helicus]|uniref:Uncharacterized protein n=1 Tax=Blyttiomyces helicus TaxID=388810 RepID=A0A4P9WC40_9FUNG|nr:hypothetical protein BDK51DRAFT_50999 [Blyttiomyces helicus]|eukprot:RKO88440.1 hypothetical protein BDK51DRAFT_50999 [Blyttiomyces helicus]
MRWGRGSGGGEGRSASVHRHELVAIYYSVGAMLGNKPGTSSSASEIGKPATMTDTPASSPLPSRPRPTPLPHNTTTTTTTFISEQAFASAALAVKPLALLNPLSTPLTHPRVHVLRKGKVPRSRIRSRRRTPADSRRPSVDQLSLVHNLRQRTATVQVAGVTIRHYPSRVQSPLRGGVEHMAPRGRRKRWMWYLVRGGRVGLDVGETVAVPDRQESRGSLGRAGKGGEVNRAVEEKNSAGRTGWVAALWYRMRWAKLNQTTQPTPREAVAAPHDSFMIPRASLPRRRSSISWESIREALSQRSADTPRPSLYQGLLPRAGPIRQPTWWRWLVCGSGPSDAPSAADATLGSLPNLAPDTEPLQYAESRSRPSIVERLTLARDVVLHSATSTSPPSSPSPPALPIDPAATATILALELDPPPAKVATKDAKYPRIKSILPVAKSETRCRSPCDIPAGVRREAVAI